MRQNLNPNFKINRHHPRKVIDEMRSSFEREQRFHRFFFKFLLTFITIVFVAVFSFYGFVAYNAIKLIDHPEAFGNYVGRVIKGFEQGAGK